MIKNTKKASIRRQIKKRTKATLVPTKANQYRPHLIRRYGLVAIATLVVLLQGYNNFLLSGSVLGDKTSVTDNELLLGTNQQRTEVGEPTLKLSSQLSEAAALKAQDMFAKQYWAHQSPDGVQPWAWFSKVNYTYQTAGENLAKNFVSSPAVIAAWMDSPEHRKNMLDGRFTEVGFAVMTGTMQGSTQTIVVALYGQPQANPAVLGVTTPPATLAAVSPGVGISQRLQIFVHALSPLLAMAFLLTVAVFALSLVAHRYRRRMPKALQKTWKLHHGMIKAIGSFGAIIVFVLIYSGGQL